MSQAAVVCAGGAVLDRHLHLLAPAVPGTSNPARAASSAGGVARNVAENLALLGVQVRLVSRVGGDDAGRQLLRGLAARGVDVTAVAVGPAEPTAQYVALLDPGGELVIGAAAMDVLDGITAADLDAAWPGAGDWVFLDCNLAAPVLSAALERARAVGTPIAVDAVSAPKVTRLAGGAGGAGPGNLPLTGISVLFCNLDEAAALFAALGLPSAGGQARPEQAAPVLAAALTGQGAAAVVLTLGARGVVVAHAGGVQALPATPATVVDVTGAGDALVAATLARLTAGARLDDAVRCGIAAASLTVASPFSVRPDLAAALA